MDQAKAITIVDTGRSYDVFDEHEFLMLLKKLGVEDIMNVENKRIPGGFKSLKDGGEYTVKIPVSPIVPVNISINDQRSSSEQGSNASASTKNPNETVYLECSQGRYSIEIFYSRVTNREAIAGILKRHQFVYFDDLNHWANMYRPLQTPAKHKDFLGFEEEKEEGNDS